MTFKGSSKEIIERKHSLGSEPVEYFYTSQNSHFIIFHSMGNTVLYIYKCILNNGI